jgi:hypothetical protein
VSDAELAAMIIGLGDYAGNYTAPQRIETMRSILTELQSLRRLSSRGVVKVTDEMIFAAMVKADEIGEPLDDIDAREIIGAAVSALVFNETPDGATQTPLHLTDETQSAIEQEQAEPDILILQQERDRLREALRPFADAVFNDNGDMSIDLSAPQPDDFINAYFAARAALEHKP